MQIKYDAAYTLLLSNYVKHFLVTLNEPNSKCKVVDFHILTGGESPFQFGPRPCCLLGSQLFGRGMGPSLRIRGQKGQLTRSSEQRWVSFSRVSVLRVYWKDAVGRRGMLAPMLAFLPLTQLSS